MVRVVLIRRLQRLVGVGAQRAEHGFGLERQLGEAHADRILDRVGDRRRHAEGRDLPDPLGAERAVLWCTSTGSLSMMRRHVEQPGDLVVGERALVTWPPRDHLLEHGEAELHQRAAGNLRLDDAPG